MAKKTERYCGRPDRDVPTIACGYPLPCPYHTVILNPGASITVQTTRGAVEITNKGDGDLHVADERGSRAPRARKPRRRGPRRGR